MWVKIGGIEVTYLFCFCNCPSYFLKGFRVSVSFFFLLPLNIYTWLLINALITYANISYNQDHRGVMTTTTWPSLLMQGWDWCRTERRAEDTGSVLGGIGALEQNKSWEALGLEEQRWKRITVKIFLRYAEMCHTEESVTTATKAGSPRVWVPGGKHKAGRPKPALHLVLSARHHVPTRRQAKLLAPGWGVVTFMQS